MPNEHVGIDGPGYVSNDESSNNEERSINIFYLKYGEVDGFVKQILNGEPLDSFSLMGRSGLPFENATMNGQYDNYLSTPQKIYRLYHNKTNMDVPREPFASPYVLDMSTGILEQDVLEPYFSQYGK